MKINLATIDDLQSLVKEVERCINQGFKTKSLDIMFRTLDSYMKYNNIQPIREFCQLYNWETADIDLAVTMLMTIKPERRMIPERKKAVDRFLARLEIEAPERACNLRKFL